MRSKDKSGLLTGAISLFIGLLSGMITYFASTRFTGQHQELDAAVGWLTGLTVTTLSVQLGLGIELARIHDTAEEGVKLGKRAIKVGSINKILTEKVQRLAHMPDLVQDVTLAAIETAIKSFDIDRDDTSAYIRGRRLALESYTKFWHRILEYQKQNTNRVVARMTHSTDVSWFNDDRGASLNGVQAQFCENGDVFRILIDREKFDIERMQTYIRVMDGLSTFSICSAYVNIHDIDHLLMDYVDKEFCIIDEIECTAEWDLRDAHELKGLIIASDAVRYRSNLNKWDRVLSHLRSTKIANLVDEKIAILIEKNEIFLKKYDEVISQNKLFNGSTRRLLPYRKRSNNKS